MTVAPSPAFDAALAYSGGASEPTEQALAGQESFAELARLTLDGTDASIERVLALARTQLEMDIAFLAAFAEGSEVFEVVEGDGESFGVKAGGQLPLAATYCHRVIRGELPNAIPNARNDSRVSAVPVTNEADIGAYVGVPVRLWDGRLYGTLCCLSHRAAPSLNRRDVKFMHVLARVVAEQLERQQLEAEKRRVEAERIRSVLAGDAISIVYQPVLDLTDSRLVGWEALARFRGDVPRPACEWFAGATEVGLRTDLELAAVAAAVEELDEVVPGVFLSVNVSPATVVAPRLLDLIGDAAGRIVVELSEHARVESYTAFTEALADIRARGARVAIDDVGAGVASVRHILRFAPDLVKVDVAVTADIAKDPARRALASSLVALASRIDARVIAEGVETQADLEVLRELGVHYGQGYHLGRPVPWAARDRQTERMLAAE